MFGSICEQKSKCPISSEKATLYECADHRTPTPGFDVEYIGWKSYGVIWQFFDLPGTNLI